MNERPRFLEWLTAYSARLGGMLLSHLPPEKRAHAASRVFFASDAARACSSGQFLPFTTARPSAHGLAAAPASRSARVCVATRSRLCAVAL